MPANVSSDRNNAWHGSADSMLKGLEDQSKGIPKRIALTLPKSALLSNIEQCTASGTGMLPPNKAPRGPFGPSCRDVRHAFPSRNVRGS
jgi:hypothetical protein